jgi:hypothetical protein
MPKKIQLADRDSFKFLVCAAALAIVISYIPFASILIYPIRLFVTFIHEGGHAIMALLTLGSVDRVMITSSGDGVTYTRGGIQLLIASAGYLTTTGFGAVLLVLCSRGQNAKAVLTVTAGIILALTAFFTNDPFSWLTGILLSVGLVWAAIGLSQRWAHFALSFLAVQCCLNALFDLRTLFLISTTTSMHSDAVNMQAMTMVPAALWAVLWILISIVTLIAALRNYAIRVIR